MQLEELKIVQHPSLHLNFLYGKKSIDHVDISFLDSSEKRSFFGIYFPPGYCGILHNLIIPYSSRGRICVNIYGHKDEDIISCICHEFRHHMQFLSGITFDNYSVPIEDCGEWDGYVNYFLKNFQEWDALHFERSKIESEYTSILWDHIASNNLNPNFE